jgi:branched-chain amino acid transport system permease protein
VAVLLPEWLRFTEGFYLMGYAVLVMLLMALCPSGLLGLADRLTKPAARGTADVPISRPDGAVQSEGAR